MPPRAWRFRLDDMLAAIQQIRGYVHGMDLESFRSDPRTVDAVVYRLAVIGEAANARPDEVTERLTQVPWRAIRGLRSRVMHETARALYRLPEVARG